MKDKSIPEVAKISALFSALKIYIDMHAGSCCGPQSADVLDTPPLASGDALDWYGVIQDIEMIDFLISGTKEADRLLGSLQSCINCQMQPRVDHIRRHSRITN